MYRPKEMASGLTTVTSWWKTPEGPKVGMKLIDGEGRVLHEWLADRGEVFGDAFQRKDPTSTDVQGSLLLPGGDVVINLEYVGAARLNSCGKILWTQTEGNHHSIAQGEDGSFWMPGVSEEQRTGSDKYPNGYTGLGPVWIDRILHVSEEGRILDDINVLDLLYENGLDRFIFQHRKKSGDITHMNDVEPLSSSLSDEYPLFNTGDLLISLRNINIVFVIGPESKKVKWYSRDPFILQHDPDFIGDGWIGVFDNNRGKGSATGEGSRIIALQPHTDSSYTLFRPDLVDRFYTAHRGKWQMLENGNMLLSEEEAGRALEVSAEGRAVWEWVHESYDSKVSPVTKATRHDLTREEIASWPCSPLDSMNTSAQGK